VMTRLADVSIFCANEWVCTKKSSKEKYATIRFIIIV